MPTRACSKNILNTWVRMETTPLNGEMDILIRAKSLGTAITVSASTPTVGLGADDPIYYLDLGSQIKIRGNPSTLWFNSGGSADVSFIMDY